MISFTIRRRILIITAFLLILIYRCHLTIFQLSATSSDIDYVVPEYFENHFIKATDKRRYIPIQRRLSNVADQKLYFPKIFHLCDLDAEISEHKSIKCVFSKTNPPFPVCVYDISRDRYISAALLSSGIWEPYITKVFQIALRRHPDASVIDIGANIGYYSFLAAGSGHKVIAVEPIPENVIRFQKGANLGGVTDKIHLLINAISDGHRNVTFTTNRDNQGGIKVQEGSIGVHEARTITLDDLLYLVSSETVVIKMDIEGYECKAMAKSARLFEKVHVPYVFMEWRQMYTQQRQRGCACPAKAMLHLSGMMAARGYVAHEVRMGIELNSDRSNTEWRIGDIYWRHRDAMPLIPPI